MQNKGLPVQKDAMQEMLILVNKDDKPIGADTKLRVHQLGMLHRAFSLFIFDEQGRFMLQQRAACKYHSAGLWSNTCCGHPRQGETLGSAAHRRLQEEMGFDCPLQEVSTLTYRSPLSNDLIEHEYDHILVGHYNRAPTPNPSEAAAWQWLEETTIAAQLRSQPQRYTIWFQTIFQQTPSAEFKRWQAVASAAAQF